jgi:hypothetical protein
LSDAGPTETEFFERAEMMDIKVGADAQQHRKLAKPGTAKRKSATAPKDGVGAMVEQTHPFEPAPRRSQCKAI